LSIPLVLMLVSNFEKWKFIIYISIVMMLPKHLIWFKLTELDVNVTLNSFVNPILLLASIIVVFVRGGDGKYGRNN